MHNYYEVLKKNHIFDNMSAADMKSMSECFQPEIMSFNKGDKVFSQGDTFKKLGIIAAGIINIVKEDDKGNKFIIEQAEPGAVLDESIGIAEDYKVNVSAEVSVAGKVIAIPFEKLVTTCEKNCPFHVKLLSNIVKLVASNHNALTMKVDFLSKKSVRHKLFSFFGHQKEKHGRREFDINFDRKELAEFLFVDRSALSRELSRMRKEGMIEFHKNHFKIISLPEV